MQPQQRKQLKRVKALLFSCAFFSSDVAQFVVVFISTSNINEPANKLEGFFHSFMNRYRHNVLFTNWQFSLVAAEF